MDPRYYLNEFPLMDTQIVNNLTDVGEYNEQIVNIETIRSIIMKTDESQEIVVNPVGNEREHIEYLFENFGDGTGYTRNQLRDALRKLEDIKNRKRVRAEQTLDQFIRDVVVAYVRNCANYRFNDIPLDFFTIGSANIRFQISKLHIIATTIALEDPAGFENFRRTYADLFEDFSNLETETYSVLAECLFSWYNPVIAPNWDGVVAKLMVVAHLVCKVIQMNGMNGRVKARVNRMVWYATQNLRYSCHGDFLLTQQSWRNMELLRVLNKTVTNNTVTNLDIPTPHAVLDRSRPGTKSRISEKIDAQSMQDALKAFIPVYSEDFMGVCEPPVVPLFTAAYNRLPVNTEDRAQVASMYAPRPSGYEGTAKK